MKGRIKQAFFLWLLIAMMIGSVQATFAANKTGLVKKNGKWVYMENGKTSTKTGLTKRADGKGGWYYVERGVLCSNKAGITKRIDGKGTWYYVEKGSFRNNKTGLTKRVDGKGGWFYVEKGVLQTKKAGLTKRIDGKGGWFYVEKGRLCTNKAGLTKRIDGKGGWFYVEKGKLCTNKACRTKRIDGKGGWYYVRNGKLDTTKTGNLNPECSHSWEKVYKTVHHDAITHKETFEGGGNSPWVESYVLYRCSCGAFFVTKKQLSGHQKEMQDNGITGHNSYITMSSKSEDYYKTVKQKTDALYGCQCAALFITMDELYTHQFDLEDMGVSGHSSYFSMSSDYQGYYDIETKTITVVDQEAYDEKVFIGYKCTKCGITKSK